MKILHVGQMIGGLDIYIRNTICYADKDFEYVIVHGKDDKNRPVIKNGVAVKEYSIDLYRALNPYKDFKAIFQTIMIIKKENPDVIHCHSAKGGVVGRIAGYLTHTKTFYTPHAFSFLSSESLVKSKIYLMLERMVKFNSYLLACSESERVLGVEKVHYNKEHALAWSNSVPDAAKEVGDGK